MTVRLLITGATGVIGRHALAAVPDALAPRVDLFDRPAVRAMLAELQPTHLLHLAWYTRHGSFWTAPENLDWVAATLDLVRAFAAAGGRRFVGTGTCAEYDWTRSDDRPWREDDPCRPATFYGQAKLATWQLIGHLDLSLAWGRVFFPYGPGEAPGRLVPSVARALKAGEPARCSSGRQPRDFMHVSDVGGALAALALSRAEGPVNIASGVPTTIAEVATTLGRLAGRPDLVALGALPDRPGEPASMVADVGRLRDEVGYQPRVSLEAGLKEVLAITP